MLLGTRQHQRVPQRSPYAVPLQVFVPKPEGVARLRCAAFAVDPAGVPASIMFLLADRDAVLHFIDDEPAGVEGFAAVGGADTHPHRHVRHPESADPMDAGGMLDGTALQRLRQDPVALL